MALKAGLVGVLLVAVFSGCVGSDAAESSVKSVPPAPPAEADGDTGGVEGVVTDDQINPIVGAQVGFTDVPAIIATTDEAGRFSLSRVPPGTHTLVAQKLGFEATAKKVDVVAGEVVRGLALVVLPLAVEEPYPETLTHKGIIKNGVGIVLTATCSNCGTAETFYKFKKGLPEDMAGLMIEAEWKTTDYLGIDIVDRGSGGGVYWRIRDNSPIHYFVEKCGSYLDPPYYASKPLPCEDNVTAANGIQAETWYIGGFQEQTHNADAVCRASVVFAYKAGCYGLGYIAELVFTDYYTIFHRALPDDLSTFSRLQDK
ncbi:MAG: carboxypeptidase regulatory-like domain-containing protein [Euryarchaeota archaeon]|nr:carboxypeptidase regulatory-like domain-containing protein [Euryarchaeota archaeon]